MKKEELEKKSKLYKAVFGTDNGKEVLKDLEKHFFYNSSILSIKSDGFIDPNKVIANEGMRYAILYIKKYVEMELK